VEKLFNYYKKKLALDNWEIEVFFSKGVSFHGNVEMDLERRRATITLNMADDIRELRGTIVHELSHIILVMAHKPVIDAYKSLIDKMTYFNQEQACRRIENLVK